MAQVPKLPIDEKAAKAARKQFYRDHPELVDKTTGKCTPLDPNKPNYDRLRRDWVKEYKAAGGKTKRVYRKKKKRLPDQVNQPCELKEIEEVKLVELIEVVKDGGDYSPVKGVAPAPKTSGEHPHRNAGAPVARAATNPERQYINLPRDDGGVEQPHQDRYVEVRARIEWKEDKFKDYSLAGWKVHFSCTRTEGGPNRPGSLYRAGREHFELAANREADPADPIEVTTDAAGWTPAVKFYLSKYGGDKFKIAAQAEEDDKGTKGEGIETGKYEVWRRIQYRLGCMKRPDGSNYSNRVAEADLKSKFRDHFIQFEPDGNVTQIEHKLVVQKATASAWTDGELGAAPDRTINFALLDILSKGDIPFDYDFDPPAADTVTKDLDGYDYAFDLSAKNRWLVSAKYIKKSDNTSHDIPDDKVKLELNGLDFKLTVDLNGLAGRPPLNDMKVELKLIKQNDLSGLSSDANTIVAMRWREKEFKPTGKEADATLHTMLHEAGHFLGLAPKWMPDNVAHTDATKQANWYYQNGNHCHGLADQCIMFASFQLTLNFCDNCGIGLKGRDLSSPKVRGNSDY